jgi:hypothetical protein
MRGTRWAVGLAAAALVMAGGRAADDGYDLRGPAPVKGQVYRSKSTFRVKGADVTLTAAGNTLKLKQTMTVTTEEEEKVLAVDGRTVAKSQAKVIKDRVVTVTDFNGDEQKQDEPGELEGQVIVSTRTPDGKWKHVLVDEKPTEKQKKELDKRVGPENDDELFPEGKVKVGHTWEVDAAHLKKFFGNTFTDVKGKLKQNFLRVEEVNGEMCAVVETTGPVTATMKEDDGDLKVQLTLKATGWRSLKTGVEVKGKFEGKIRMSGKQKIDGAEADIVMEGPISGDGTTVLK